MDDKRRSAAIYTRISKDRNGESLGVDRQEKACRKLASAMGARVVGVYSDNDISAFSGKRRPDFERLLVDIAAGKIDTLLCQHTDRLYRSVKDLTRLFDAGPRLLIKTVQGGDIDLGNSTGKMLATILAGVQEQESAHHSERRKLAYVQQATSGGYDAHGNRAFGYDRDGQPYEPEATLFRNAAADVLEGKSLRGVAREWNARGVTTTLAGATRTLRGRTYTVEGVWSATRIKRLLLNPRYAGIRMHLGKVAGVGEWTPLIDEDTHRRLVSDLRDPARVKVTSFERKYVGSGVYVCGVCGATMRVSFPGRGGRKYACSAHSCVMRAGDPVDDYVENAMLARLSRKDAKLLIAKRGVDVGALQDARAGWIAKLDNLVELLDDGTLDGPKARDKAAGYKAEIAAIDSQLAAAARTSPTAALLATGKELRQRWVDLPPSVRSQIIDEIAVVTINPTRRGVRVFDAAAIDIAWKDQ